MKEELNLSWPYRVFKDTENSIYTFTTKNQIQYNILFSDAQHYFADYNDIHSDLKIYSIDIQNISSKNAPLDFSTEYTIGAIVKNFFMNTDYSLLYICDISDNKQDKRKNKFKSWFENHNIGNLILKKEKTIKELYHTTLLFHTENPHKDKIVFMFQKYMEYLDEK